MPRYFFRLEDGGTLLDDTGEMLSDDDAARDAAIEVFCETIGSKKAHLNDGGRYEVMVTRDTHEGVYVIAAEGRRL